MVQKMPVKLVKIGTSAGIGLIDIGLEELDSMQGWTEPFKNAHDIFRAGVFAFGLANELMLHIIPSEVAESMVDASFPLLEKSIYGLVKSMTGAGYREIRLVKVRESSPAPQAPASALVSV